MVGMFGLIDLDNNIISRYLSRVEYLPEVGTFLYLTMQKFHQWLSRYILSASLVDESFFTVLIYLPKHQVLR